MDAIEVFPEVTITNDMCALLPTGTVVIADLHIGYESAMEEQGLSLPRIQVEELRDRLLHILDKYQPDRMVILGDLKHEFSKNLRQEWDDVQHLLSLLKNQTEVIIVRGNHDNYLATIASKMEVPMVREHREQSITFTHGHGYSDQRPIVIGHEHPSIKIYDEVGAYVRFHCYMFDAEEEILVLPAFSPLASGTNLSRADSRSFLSPILKDHNPSRMEVFACSEIGLLSLGQLSDIVEQRARLSG